MRPNYQIAGGRKTRKDVDDVCFGSIALVRQGGGARNPTLQAVVGKRPEVTDFERSVSSDFGQKWSVAVMSGRFRGLPNHQICLLQGRGVRSSYSPAALLFRYTS